MAEPPGAGIDTSPTPKPHAVAKERANRPGAAPGWPAMGVLIGSETTDRENDICRSNSGVQDVETVHPDIDMDAAARRIADELVKPSRGRRDQKRARRFILREPDPSLRSQFYYSRGIVCAKARIV
jgi:hypothetical protein